MGMVTHARQVTLSKCFAKYGSTLNRETLLLGSKSSLLVSTSFQKGPDGR